MRSYKAGNGIPEISDSEAVKLYEESHKSGKLPSPPDLDKGHVDEEVEEDEDDDEDDEEKEGEKTDDTSTEEDTPEPVKAPPPKRSKTAKEAKAGAKQVPVKEVQPIVTERSTQSPEKKKKKSSKKDAKGASDVAQAKKDIVENTSSPTPKAASPEKQKKGKGKKRKSEAT